MRARRPCLIAVALCLSWSLACAADGNPPGDAVVTNPVELQSLQQLSATAGRPLFSPARRPPPKPVAPVVVAREEPPPPPPPPPSVVLLGIVSENGDGRAAIRAGDTSDKVVRVRAGDDVGGWKVDRVEPRRLVLTQGERSVDFALFGGATKGTDAKPAKSAAAKTLERRLRQIRTVPPSD